MSASPSAFSSLDPHANTSSNADALWFAPAQLLRLFSNSPVAMAYWGQDQRLRLATPQWCEWFGIPSTAVAGQLLTEAMPHAFIERHSDALQAAALGQRQQFDDQRTDAHGQVEWRRISLSPYIWRNAAATQPNNSPSDGVLMLMQDCSAEYAGRAEAAALREHMAAHRRPSKCAHKRKQSYLNCAPCSTGAPPCWPSTAKCCNCCRTKSASRSTTHRPPCKPR